MIEEPQALDHLAGLLHESVIEVEGVAVVNPQAPGGVEVHRPEIRVLAPSAAVPLVELYYPTPKSDPATLLDHAALTLRHPRARGPDSSCPRRRLPASGTRCDRADS